MLTTPAVMNFLIEDLDQYDPYDINPSIIAFDEFDLCLNNPGMSKASLNIIRKFAGESDPIFQKDNAKRQFIFTGATMPRSLQKQPALDTLKNWFSGTKALNV